MSCNSYRWTIVETSIPYQTTVLTLNPYRDDGGRSYRDTGKWVPRAKGDKLVGWNGAWAAKHFRDYRNQRAVTRALRSLRQRFPTASFEVWHRIRVPKTGKWMIRTWTYTASA